MDWHANVRGTRPSTLRDLRSILAEPGTPHARGTGTCRGRILAALGDRPAAEITTREVGAFLRSLDDEGLTARNVNKHRQIVSRDLRLRVPPGHLRPGREPGRRHGQAPRAAAGGARLLRARGGRAARPHRRGRAASPAGRRDRTGRDRRALRRGRPGRRALPPARLHRAAHRRGARPALERRRPGAAAADRPACAVGGGGGTDQGLAGPLRPAGRSRRTTPSCGSGPAATSPARRLRLLRPPRRATRRLSAAPPLSGGAQGGRPALHQAARPPPRRGQPRRARDRRRLRPALPRPREALDDRAIHARQGAPRGRRAAQPRVRRAGYG